MNEAKKAVPEASPTPPTGQRVRKLLLSLVLPLLSFAGVFVVGAFVSAFVAFVLLPIAIGFCSVQFFRSQRRCAEQPKWPALVFGNSLIFLFLASLSFLVLETYFRFVYDQTDAMAMTLVSGAWSARHFHLNSLGLRDNLEYTNALTPGRRRVTFVGDSFTAGFGVKDVENRFVNRIRRRHPDWEVHCAAKPGLDTSTEVELMHNLTVSNGYRLDQVVLVYAINDIGELMTGWVEGYKKMLADPFRKSWLCQNSYFVNLFYLRWLRRKNAYMQKYYDEVEAAYHGRLWEMEKIGLLAFSNLTRIRGGRLLVVTFPYMDTGLRFKSVHDQLDHYWKERGIPHLDLLATFSNFPPAKLMVNPNDSHPNEFAHALAAQAIDEFLRHEIPDRTKGKPE